MKQKVAREGADQMLDFSLGHEPRKQQGLEKSKGLLPAQDLVVAFPVSTVCSFFPPPALQLHTNAFH